MSDYSGLSYAELTDQAAWQALTDELLTLGAEIGGASGAASQCRRMRPRQGRVGAPV
jgi:hypothetical protein